MCLPGKNPLFRPGCDWGSVSVASEEGHKRAGGGSANWPQGFHHQLTENFLSLPWALLLICCWYLHCTNSLIPRLETELLGEGDPPHTHTHTSGEGCVQGAWELRAVCLRKQRVCFLKPHVVHWSHWVSPGQKLLPPGRMPVCRDIGFTCRGGFRSRMMQVLSYPCGVNLL